MANQKNNIVKVPLNGEINFSKMKTGVSQYAGFNDINSPLYGDTISPLYKVERDTRSSGNSRPYIDKDNVLRDKDGVILLDFGKKSKGLKRTKLSGIPRDALAVFDSEHYVTINETEEYTSIFMGKDEKTNILRAKALPFLATAATYSEEKYHLLIVAERGYLHIYDSNTLEELTQISAMNKQKVILNTFYDEYNKWHVITMHEPFGDWDYHKAPKAFTITSQWTAWDQKRVVIEKNLEQAKKDSTTAKENYYNMKVMSATLAAEVEAAESARDWFYDEWVKPAAEAAEASGGPSYTFGDFSYGSIGNVGIYIPPEVTWYLQVLEWAKAYDDAVTAARKKKSDWESANGGSEERLKEIWDAANKVVTDLTTQLSNHYAGEPKKYKDDPKNPNFFYGKVDEAFNFFFDAETKEIERKVIDIPWDALNRYSDGPSGNSYIISGIYDTHLLVDQKGNWIDNTDDDFIRYRLEVIPHSFGSDTRYTPDDDPRPTNVPEYTFMLPCSPKIYFRKRNIKAPLTISTDIPKETPLFVTNIKLDPRPWLGKTYQQYSTSDDIFFSGSGSNGRISTWAKTLFNPETEPSIKPGKPETGLPNQRLFNFNMWNSMHDYGGSPYSFYSPWSVVLEDGEWREKDSKKYETMGNCFTTVDTTKKINRTYINYDVCSSYKFYNIPQTPGEHVEEFNPKNIFREVISNGILSNISVTEDRYSLGTLIETPNSIEPIIPIFYKQGRDGGFAVYRNIQGDWIEVEVTDKIQDIRLINDEYVLVYTTSTANCVRLSDRKVKHWAPDWNNRFSLVGCPYPQKILPVTFPTTAPIENDFIENSAMNIASAINANWEITNEEISGYAADRKLIYSNASNITYIGYISKNDTIDLYFSDFKFTQVDTPKYMSSIDPSYLAFSLFGNIQLEGAEYPSTIFNVPGLFCNIRPSNFGRYYLDDGYTFYSLTRYNSKLYYNFYTNSEVSDTKELFMVQGQTFALTKSDYLYSVFLSENGTANLNDALINVKGLRFCGAIPEMAIFYSPMDRTLKSFTADHIMKDMQQATLISNVYYTTYNPQTSAVYICTNNGVYVYSANSQYRLPINRVQEIYFGGENDKHTYIVYNKEDEDGKNITSKTVDYVFDRGYAAFIDPSKQEYEIGSEYKIEPVKLTTKYYGIGNNGIAVNDCVYFRLFSDIGPVDTILKVSESTINDDVYRTATKELKILKSDWDVRTSTCYVRYQPKQQRSAGISISVETTCAISEINFSVSEQDTVATAKPKLNM